MIKVTYDGFTYYINDQLSSKTVKLSDLKYHADVIVDDSTGEVIKSRLQDVRDPDPVFNNGRVTVWDEKGRIE